MRQGVLPVLALGLAVFAPGAARADFSGPLSPGAFEATMNMGPIAQTLRQQIQPQRQPPQPKTATRQAPPSRPPALAAPSETDLRSLRFTPSPARRKANFDSFLASTRRRDPGGAAQLAKEFAERDMIGEMQAPLAAHGLRVDDLADAYALWWINAWSASQGHNRTPDAATVSAVKRQAARALVGSGMIAGAGDAAKQSFAETLLIQSAMIDSMVEQAKGQPALLRQIGEATLQGGRAIGLDLATMRLTRAGFVPAG